MKPNPAAISENAKEHPNRPYGLQQQIALAPLNGAKDKLSERADPHLFIPIADHLQTHLDPVPRRRETDQGSQPAVLPPDGNDSRRTPTARRGVEKTQRPRQILEVTLQEFG